MTEHGLSFSLLSESSASAKTDWTHLQCRSACTSLSLSLSLHAGLRMVHCLAEADDRKTSGRAGNLSCELQGDNVSQGEMRRLPDQRPAGYCERTRRVDRGLKGKDEARPMIKSTEMLLLTREGGDEAEWHPIVTSLRNPEPCAKGPNRDLRACLSPLPPPCPYRQSEARPSSCPEDDEKADVFRNVEKPLVWAVGYRCASS